VARKQPDILNLHLEFLRACEELESIITVTTIKLGVVTSTFQLELMQNGQTRVVALATSINFDKAIGPSISVPAPRIMYPESQPTPNFDLILANKREENWITACFNGGEILPLTRGIGNLYPRDGHLREGICDTWNYLKDERINSTYLAMWTDVIPSMSDTLLRNGGVYDAHAAYDKMKRWADENPGIPLNIKTTLREAMSATTFNVTVTLDMEFTKRVPEEGLRFLFTRTATNILRQGRMSVDVTICDENMELVCAAHQVILVLEAERKFRTNRGKSSL
jgi:hypothetical protein